MSISAPAKIILFGEHAVVYGEPAIAVPVSSLRAQATIKPGRDGLHIEAVDVQQVLPVELDTEDIDDALTITAKRVLKQLGTQPPDATIRITSTIPMASGLGSGAAVSAAVARAVAQAVNQPLDNNALNAIVYEIEKLYHGTPSGIDNTVIVHEKPVYFVRGEPIQPLLISTPLTFVIGDTGEAALTKVTVGDVRKLYDTDKERIGAIIASIGHITRKARQAIAKGDTDAIGTLMQANQQHLQTLTVSSPALETLIDAALNAGAYGAKLSGGGRGGNMIALVPAPKAEAVRQALEQAGAARTTITTVEATP